MCHALTAVINSDKFPMLKTCRRFNLTTATWLVFRLGSSHYSTFLLSFIELLTRALTVPDLTSLRDSPSPRQT